MTLFDAGDATHDLAGRTIAALKRIVSDESRLKWMEGIAFGKSLYGRDRLALLHDGQRQAGIDAATVDVNRARAALA